MGDYPLRSYKIRDRSIPVAQIRLGSDRLYLTLKIVSTFH